MSYLSDLELIKEIDDTTPVFYRNFAANPVLNPEIADEITFTRSSVATRVGPLGLIVDAGVDVPRFDYTPNLRTNRHFASEVFNTNISLGNSVITSTTELSPTSTNNATRFRADTANTIHRIVDARFTQVPVGTIITVSIYVKASGYNYFGIQTDSGKGCLFDLVSGTVVSYYGGLVSGGAVTAASNGYWRVSLTCTTSIASSDIRWTISNDGANIGFIGDGVSGVVVWGAQFEVGAVSPYQATPNTIGGPICKGLLIEESRTNTVKYSEDFTNVANWARVQVTVAASATPSPDGVNAQKVIPTAVLAAHRCEQPMSITSGVAYTISVFAKAAEYSGLCIVTLFGVNAFAHFNLLNGASNVVGGTSATTSVTDFGGGWYRCSITATATVTSSVSPQIRVQQTYGSGDVQYTGDGTSGIYLWGAQIEAGAFPTSYIRTTTATVTRGQDICTVNSTNLSKWYRQDEGSWMLMANLGRVPLASQFFHPLSVEGATAANQFTVYINLNSGQSRANIKNVTNNTINAEFALIGSLGSSEFKLCSAYSRESIIGVVNGGTAVSDTAITLAELSNMRIGATVAGGGVANAHFAAIAYYPKRLSNRLLKALTLP